MNHYFNIINIDRYDVIIGMVFMKQHRIMLDFEKDQVRMRVKTSQHYVKSWMTTCKCTGKQCDIVKHHKIKRYQRKRPND